MISRNLDSRFWPDLSVHLYIAGDDFLLVPMRVIAYDKSSVHGDIANRRPIQRENDQGKQIVRRISSDA